MAKTPAPKAPAQAAVASAGKPSAKKPENQQAEATKGKQTPSKALLKKLKEEEDDESDDDDREEKAAFTGKGKKTADPEDEELDEDDEDAEQDEEHDEDGIFVVTDNLAFGNQVGIFVPAGSSLHVIGAEMEHDSFPLHLTSACLGPDAVEDDRATLVVSTVPHFHDEEDEEDEEHDHDHDHGEVDEIVAGTLCMKYAENIQLDLVLDGDFLLTNTSKDTDIYVTGRLIIADDNDDEYDEDYESEEDEEDEDDEDEDEDTETSRMELDDEDDDDEEEEEDPEVAKARALEMRKRLLGDSASKEPKKAKTAAAPAGAPKVLDVKPAEKKAAAAAAPAKAAAGAKGEKPTADAVTSFVLGELKTKKTIKNTDLGSMIVGKFGVPFKAMGFEDKSLIKFLEAHAKGKISAAGDSVKLIE